MRALDEARATSGSSGQTWSATGYAANARFVADLAGPLLTMLDVKPNERILDLGCGDGVLTEKIARLGADVLGVDASPSLLDAARQRGLTVQAMDGQALTFSSEFDAIFSNAALHWMLRPRDVLAGVGRALKPGGRFLAEFGGHGNVAAVVTALRSAAQVYDGDASLAMPWYFPTVDEYRALLNEAGFSVQHIALVPRPTPLPTGIEGWLETFAVGFLQQFTSRVRKDVIRHVIELLRPSLCDSQGQWTADYVRLRVVAKLEGRA